MSVTVPIKDGVDDRPLGCAKLCRDCGRECRVAVVEAALRIDGWMPIADAPLSGTGFEGGKWVISTAPVELEGLTIFGSVVDVRYFAVGDYHDRWIMASGFVMPLTHWRVPRRLVDRVYA